LKPDQSEGARLAAQSCTLVAALAQALVAYLTRRDRPPINLRAQRQASPWFAYYGVSNPYDIRVIQKNVQYELQGISAMRTFLVRALSFSTRSPR